jgi:hypothetical protein
VATALTPAETDDYQQKAAAGVAEMVVVFILFWFLEVRAHSLCMFVLYPNLLLRGKRGSCQFTVPKGTDRVFLRYRFGIYQEIPTKYQPKIPYWYTTLADMQIRFV